MPPLRRWVQFLGSAGAIVGLGVAFVKYGTPDDEEFLKKLSPELRSQYQKEKEIRAKAESIMQKRVEDTRDKPAWLQGSSAMRKLDREVVEEARKLVEDAEHARILELEKIRLKQLADKEKKL